jgi:plastocyanin
MRGLKVVGIGLAVLGLLFAVPAAAVALLMTVGQDDHSTTNAMPHMSSSGMGGMMTSGAQTGTAAGQLTILHVQKGCHVWSNGTTQTATMRLTMKPGQMLQIMNQDIDRHRMMQLSGPAMVLGGPMATGQAESLTFTEPGTYRFDTKSSEMKGMPEAATIGPDNTLRLTVIVG